ncbi:MAG: queuosine precursor transporter [Anaerolineae bacterium]|nr:queuosine precursor transporter [Anaerolineae bacterium]
MQPILIATAYIAAQMIADISSLKILQIAGLSVDGGTLIYALTFTLRDMVHKTAGVKNARMIVMAGGVINLLMAFMFWLVSILPADPSVGPQDAFNSVLSPVWRIVIASIIAEVLSELTDTEIYQAWVNRHQHKQQWLRVLVSNAVSIPIDSLIFCWIAFGGVYPPQVVWSIVLSNILVKVGITVFSIPGIYLVKEKTNELP